MENNAETLAAHGNGGGISQMGKAVAPDLEQLTRDFRTFVADCETQGIARIAPRGHGGIGRRASLRC